MSEKFRASSIHQLFEVQVKRSPHTVAVVFEDESLTYQQLNQKANQLAHHLQTLNIGPEVLVGICVERSLEMIIGLLGILKAGGAYVPLDPAYPTERIAYMLEDAQVPVLLTQEHLVESLPPHQARVVCLDSDWDAIADRSRENPTNCVTPDNLAYVIYTSGSTGRPKGVMVQHRGLCNLALVQYKIFDLHADSRVLQFASPCFDASVWEVIMALLAGSTLVCASQDTLLSKAALIQLLCNRAITTVTLPPSVLALLSGNVDSLEASSFPALQTIIVAGEACSPDLMTHWAQGRRFFNAYGPTESTVCATVAEYIDRSKSASIGRPIANTQVYLLDEQLQPVPVGVPGELYIGGIGLARGYLNRPDLTADRFIPNPFSDEPGQRLYKTGDLARYLPDGNIDYIGRIDNQVKIRGFRIELGEIETVLWQHPDVREAVVLAREDIPGSKRLVAYIVRKIALDRVPYHSDCLAELDGNAPVKLRTENISVGGVCLQGVPANWKNGQRIRLRLQLPEAPDEQSLWGRIVWCRGTQAGIQFDLTIQDRAQLRQSIDYLLETRGLLKVLLRTIAGSLRRFLKQKLPEHMVPSSFVFLKTLPLTPNGKVDRRALAAPDRTRPILETEYVAPRTPTEEVLAQIWAEVLGLDSVGIRDNFLELGGHSLLATQVISRVHQTFQVELPLRSLLEASTVAQMAKNLETDLDQEIGSHLPPIQPVSRDLHLPVSFAQQQLWLLAKLQPDIPVYNEPFTIRLTGPIDVEALEQGLNEIIRRHEILRTTFTEVDGQPIQVIREAKPLTLPVLTFEGIPQSHREAEALRRATEEAKRPFSLTQGPLLRATLMHLGEADYRLFLTFHHIVIDGNSLYSVFLKELEVLYVAFSTGLPLPLPELPIQYADFAHWQRQWLQGQILTTQLTYWQQQLAGLPTLQLPTDRPRSTVQTFQGAWECLALPKHLSEALKALSQKEGVTLFTLLLAAFKTLLHRYAGQDDIVVGTVASGRNRPELENSIGFFVNTLVLRTNLEANLSFRELLGRVREVTMGAYAHQDLPFEHLVDKLQAQRNLNQNPLFQVAFVLDPPMPPLDSGWNISVFDVDTGTAKFDLTVELNDRPEGIEGRFEYNSHLFDRNTIVRAIGHFQTLLEDIVAHPEQCLFELPLLTETERQQLSSWNETQADYPLDACIHQRFEAQVQQSPDTVAVVFEDESLTYHELNQRANQLAHHLRSLSVGPEVRVGICVERSLEMIIGLLGILKAGGAYVPLDPAYPPERLAFMLEDAQVSVLLTQEHLVESLPQHQARVVCLNSDWEAIADRSRENPTNCVTPDNLAYVIYTSGSTGRPKGVAISHHSADALLTWAKEEFTPEDLAGVLASTSICFDLSVFELFVPLSWGGKVILAKNVLYLPTSQVALDVTLLNTVPSAIAELMRQNSVPASVRTVNLAGEPLQNQLVQQIYQQDTIERVFNLYGPSEDTTYSTFVLVKKGSHIVTIGRPIANTQVYLLDPHMQLVPIGVPGELYIGGAGLARGYLNRPDLTADRFVPNPFSDKPGERLYKTGDLARYLSDGNIEYLGRIDQQVKIRGFRIELGEIEACLTAHPDVREAAIENWADESGHQSLVAYIVSNLIPDRVPFDSECLAEFDGNPPVNLRTEDLSLGGVGVVGVPEGCTVGQLVRLHLQLPTESQEQWLEGHIAWIQGRQAGINFAIAPQVRAIVQNSLLYFLETQGFLKALQRNAVGVLRKFVRQKLPDYMIPSQFVFLVALPLTPNGKIDRKALPAPKDFHPELEASYVAPQTQLEQAIAKIWQVVLNLEKVGVHDNFFDIGGNSLRMAQVHSKLLQVLDVDVSMVELFQYPTIHSLAERVSHGDRTASSFDQSRDRAKKQKAALNRQKQRRQSNRNNHD